MQTLIRKLTETFSPSGYEIAIREVIRTEIKLLADDFRVDSLGSLIVHKAPAGAGVSKRSPNENPARVKKIMLAAHMDEIGLMATHIDENGFVRFTGVGGIRPAALTGSRVRFMDGATGVTRSTALPI